MPAFVLQIQDLDESGKDWRFAIGTEWLSSALAGTELRPSGREGGLRVRAQRNGPEVLVQGHVQAELYAECARCLDDVPLDIELSLAVLFTPGPQRHANDEAEAAIEVQLDDVARDYYGGTEIVLDPMVREHLLLETPMKPLCSEECQGIAVPEHLRPPEEVFGASALDARLAPLMKLKEKLTKKEE